MSKRKCGIFTPCHEQGCMDCARRRVEHVLSLALAKSDPKWAVQVGPHRVDVPPSWPAAGRVDAVAVAFDIDTARVVPTVLAGTPGNCPQPPALVATAFSLRIPIAYVNVHAATIAIVQPNISEVPRG